MSSPNVSAVLFVKSLDALGRFYQEVFGLILVHRDSDHMVLRTDGFDLVVHQIPEHIANGIEIQNPPKRREGAAVKLSFPISQIAEVRTIAASLGGALDPEGSQWSDEKSIICMGHDPEGNVFQVSQKRS